MISLKHVINSVLSLFIISILAACSQEDVALSVDVDVIFSKKTIDDETVFGTDYYAYGNTPMNSATVSMPNGVTMLMDSYSSGFTYANITDEDDYSTSFPSIGTYTFGLTGSSDETIEISEIQDFDNLDFTEIDSMSYYDSYDGFYVSWNTVSRADSYVVLLYDLSGNLVFTGDAVDADSPEYIVVDDYYGEWESTPASDNKYTLQIQSIKYDANADDLDSYYIQEISYSDFTVTWE